MTEIIWWFVIQSGRFGQRKFWLLDYVHVYLDLEALSFLGQIEGDFFFFSLSLSLEFRFSWAHTWAVIIASGSHPPSSSSLPSGINRCMTDNSPNWTEGYFGQWSPHPPDIPVSPPASVPCLGNIWDQTRVRASEGKYFSDQRLLIFTLEPLPPKFYLSHLKPNVAQEYLGAYSPFKANISLKDWVSAGKLIIFTLGDVSKPGVDRACCVWKTGCWLSLSPILRDRTFTANCGLSVQSWVWI